MPLDPGDRIGLVRGLVHESSGERHLRADAVTDLRSEMDGSEAHLIASVLAVLAAEETDSHAREAQLHALAELHEWDATTPDAIQLLGSIDRDSLIGSEVEHVAYLLGESPT